MSWSYRPALDGLRTIAVYLVLLFHTGLPAVGGGFVGVDLFFVLSGFLVSNVILSEIDRTGRLELGKFYARRVRRLLPAAVVVVIATSLVFVLVSSVTRRLPLVGDAQSALLYVANWRFLNQSADYFATDVAESPFLHFWSLAIEEQFYVFFPVFLVLLTRATRRWGGALLVGLGGLFALSLGAQLFWGQVDVNHAYYGTDARLYQLLAGALLAAAFRAGWSLVRRHSAEVMALAGLAGLLVLGSGLLDLSPSLRGIGAMATSTMLIAGLSAREDGILAGVLSRPVPVFLGRISYGTYLWHWPVILVLEAVLTVGPTTVAVLTMAVSTGLAAASYEVLEMPIRRSALLDRFRWNTAVAGVALSALVAVTLVPSALEMERRPALTALETAPGVVGNADTRLPDQVDWDAVEHDIGYTRSCTADDPQACTVVEGSGPHVLVVGDSQAQMLAPMFETMAEEHDLTLSFNTHAGCPWQEQLVNAKQSESGLEACTEDRVGWFDDVLPLVAPDVVILVSRPRDNDEWASLVSRRDGKEQSPERAMISASRETLAKIREVVPRVLIVERMIMPETFQPDDCLTSSTDASQCAVPLPLDVSPSDAFAITAASTSPGVFAVNLNAAFCPSAPLCQAVVDSEIVWRDDHHYTASYARSRSEQVWDLLHQTGALSRNG